MIKKKRSFFSPSCSKTGFLKAMVIKMQKELLFSEKKNRVYVIFVCATAFTTSSLGVSSMYFCEWV
jgi:hypothetical protein